MSASKIFLFYFKGFFLDNFAIADTYYLEILSIGNYFKILFNLSNHDKVTFVLDLTFASADFFL